MDKKKPSELEGFLTFINFYLLNQSAKTIILLSFI